MQERCNCLKSTLAPLTVVKWPEMRERRYGTSYSFQFVDTYNSYRREYTKLAIFKLV